VLHGLLVLRATPGREFARMAGGAGRGADEVCARCARSNGSGRVIRRARCVPAILESRSRHDDGGDSGCRKPD